MKKLLALVIALAVSSVFADETANLLTNSWSGAVNYTGTGGGYSGGSTPGYNSSNNTIYFGYNQATVTQTIAINQALQGSGVQVGGVSYGFSYLNQNPYNGTLSSIVNVTSNTGSVLQSYSATHGTTTNWTQFAQTQTFTNPYDIANLGSVSMKITGKDARWWAGWYGPQVRDPYLKLTYTADLCISNPLSSTSCSGYAQAYLNQQCASNPLYSNQCAGYAAAYFTQQCTANPLYDATCPGYATAYLNYQCSINPLYSTTCAGYETAYFNQQCSTNQIGRAHV